MGFIAFCMLFGLVGWTIWNRDERIKAIAEMKEKPGEWAFLLIWIVFIFLFFFGIFVPPLGEIELADTGWQLWQIGGVGTFSLFALTFVKKNK
jgi:hypothetical protein